MLAPLAYDQPMPKHLAVGLIIESTVWLALSFVVLVLMHNVRAQRLGLRQEGERARQQARRDQLTGLFNRRAFDEDLGLALARAGASGETLSVFVADVDDFKDFNDRFGHLEGDRVLQAVATSLTGALRRPDDAYRWGGDEFALILPQAGQADAQNVAERVDAAVRLNTGPDGEVLSIATGAAEYRADAGDDAEALLERADRALRQAKGTGTFEVPG